MKYLPVILITVCAISFLYLSGIYAVNDFDRKKSEKNVLKSSDITQEKVKSSQDEKNVISEADDRDEDNFVKNSENPLNDDAFDFELHPDPYDERDL